jgi:hypothetical protein
VLREPLRISRAQSSNPPYDGHDEDLIWLITQMRRMRALAILNLETWGSPLLPACVPEREE